LGSLTSVTHRVGSVAPLTGAPGVVALAEGAPLERADRRLRADADPRALPVLDACLHDAHLLASGAPAGDDVSALAATGYVAAVVVELAANGDLDAADATVAVRALEAATGATAETARLVLFERAVRAPQLLELPPLAAAEIQLGLLVRLGVVTGATLWVTDDRETSARVAVGEQLQESRAWAAARKAIRGRASLASVTGHGLRAAAVLRFGFPAAAIVARPAPGATERSFAFLHAASAGLTPVLERDQLLARSATREQLLTRALEKRLMRVGFDLHDGPVQDVLALRNELATLARDIYPFVADSHRELAAGRFDDLVALTSGIDSSLREIAHALESRSVTSRPLGETLHRLVDEFSARSDIRATLEIVGDPESLTSAQRIAVFRAVQESLTNVREHSGARTVRVVLRARRSVIDVQVIDDGVGFDVERTLARAAQRGRLGLVGMGERVRMLGGTFSIDSRPGGPTALTFALPRVAPE
jgi:signal transduction histidine kinase